MDGPIIAELMQICSNKQDDTGEFIGLEQFCDLYNSDDILKTIIRRRDMPTDIVGFLFKSISNLKQWTIKPLKVMISVAVTHGNPLFERIPAIMESVKEDYQDELTSYLQYALHIEFGEDAAKWIG